MSVAIFDENITHAGTEFTPFDESKTSHIQKASALSTVTNRQGINTKEIDAFRQGIEISTETHRVKGLGAKIWAGNIKGYTKVDTVGQTLRFTEFEGSITWNELGKFDPVAYLSAGYYYPFPIIFNEGPQQNVEATIQPLTIPFRNGLSDDTEGPEKYRAIRGSLEDGNQDANHLNGRTNRIQQFKSYETYIEQEPFLDEGQEYFGSTITGSIILDGFLWDDERTIFPFVENNANPIVSQLNTNNADLIKLLTSVSMSIDLEEDIRGSYNITSATAGFDVYGNNMARYGTDSIAYIGRILGS